MAHCTNENNHPHGKFKWGAKNALETLHFPLLSNICMALPAEKLCSWNIWLDGITALLINARLGFNEYLQFFNTCNV